MCVCILLPFLDPCLFEITSMREIYIRRSRKTGYKTQIEIQNHLTSR